MTDWPSTLPGPDDGDYGWTEKPRRRMLSFGDGYRQRSRVGLNTIPRKWSLSWTNLSDADKVTMVTFLRERAGSEPFYWTPPQEDDPVLVKGPRWTVTMVPGDCWTIRLELEQQYDTFAGPPGGVFGILLLEGDAVDLSGDGLLLEGDMQGTSLEELLLEGV